MEKPKFLEYPFPPERLSELKRKMLNWLRPFSIFAYLDSNAYQTQPGRYELLAAAGALEYYKLDELPKEQWVFGHLNYDFKNEIDPGLCSRYPNHSGFSTSNFFRPEVVCSIACNSSVLKIESSRVPATDILKAILSQDEQIPMPKLPVPCWQFSMSREAYIETLRQIKQDIVRGDYYEINFCLAARATIELRDPPALFYRLNTANPAPFAALYRNGDAWMLGNSPERFLYKNGSRIIAQPIKGTLKSSTQPREQACLKQQLQQDIKERAENVMITDLMRNDLARCCLPGSVSVPELFGVYSFPGLLHLISTVSGQLREEISPAEILKNTFPMGSMTGAPKRIVMQRIDAYEKASRNLFSGTLGYICPDGDFDLNVNIRSLFYNSKSRQLEYQSGGAITYQSNPEQEWEELCLKAAAMQKIFGE